MPSHFGSRVIAALLLAAFAGLTSQAVAADGYGTLTGRIVFDGDVPKLLPPVTVATGNGKVPSCCAVKPIGNDSLVVNPKNKGIRHVFVYPKKVSKSDIHPDLMKSKVAEIVFDQKECAFIPHSMVVRLDQQVVVKSGDNISHNTRTVPVFNDGLNVTITANDRVGVKLPKFVSKEPLPMTVECNIHPWMKAVWLVVDHPYGVPTNADGEFKIEKLPAGEYTFVFWQERAGYLDKASTKLGGKLIEAGGSNKAAGEALVKAGEAIKGVLTVTIKPGGTTDLGDIKIPPAIFELKADELETVAKQ